MPQSNMGDIIRHIRVDKGFSQDFMAIKLEISQKTYSRIEQGSTALKLERLISIGEILEISLMDLINLWKINSNVSFTRSKSTFGNTFRDKSNCTPSNCPYRERIKEILVEIEEIKKWNQVIFEEQNIALNRQ